MGEGEWGMHHNMSHDCLVLLRPRTRLSLALPPSWCPASPTPHLSCRPSSCVVRGPPSPLACSRCARPRRTLTAAAAALLASCVAAAWGERVCVCVRDSGVSLVLHRPGCRNTSARMERRPAAARGSLSYASSRVRRPAAARGMSYTSSRAPHTDTHLLM